MGVDLCRQRPDVIAHHLIRRVGHNRHGRQNERILCHGLPIRIVADASAHSLTRIHVHFHQQFHILSLSPLSQLFAVALPRLREVASDLRDYYLSIERSATGYVR
jgi:hypothetical protein